MHKILLKLEHNAICTCELKTGLKREKDKFRIVELISPGHCDVSVSYFLWEGGQMMFCVDLSTPSDKLLLFFQIYCPQIIKRGSSQFGAKDGDAYILPILPAVRVRTTPHCGIRLEPYYYMSWGSISLRNAHVRVIHQPTT